MSDPSPRIFAAGESEYAANLLLYRDMANTVMHEPKVKVRQSVAQTFTSGVAAMLTWDTEEYDTDGMHLTAPGDTTKFTVRTSGNYSICANVGFNGNVTGYREILFYINGVGALYMVEQPCADATRAWFGHLVWTTPFLNVGDYVQVQAIQFAGVNLATYVADPGSTYCYMRRLHG